MYSPIGVNATLHCVVNSSELEWNIDDFNFHSPLEGRQLHSREIYEGSSTTLGGITTSSVIILGDIAGNNGTTICCQASLRQELELIKVCTVLIVYGRDI